MNFKCSTMTTNMNHTCLHINIYLIITTIVININAITIITTTLSLFVHSFRRWPNTEIKHEYKSRTMHNLNRIKQDYHYQHQHYRHYHHHCHHLHQYYHSDRRHPLISITIITINKKWLVRIENKTRYTENTRYLTKARMFRVLHHHHHHRLYHHHRRHNHNY